MEKYLRWMEAVDRACYRIAGISVYDLDDCPTRVWFDEGVKPITAARRALKRAGYRG